MPMSNSVRDPGRDAARDDGRPSEPEPAVRIVLRPLATPLPLGFLGLGGGTLALTGQQLGWVPATQSHLVAVAVLVTAVPLQLVASVMGFLGRDAVAATAMGTLAAAWAVTAVLTLLGPSASRSPVLGLVLFYLAAAVLVSAVAAALGKGIVAIVLTLAVARFAVTGVYEFVGGGGWMTAAGWLGLALCVIALYAAAALELEGMRQSPLLPTLRYGAARAALARDGSSAVGPVQREAGVREQL